jgi:hypothetical protein
MHDFTATTIAASRFRAQQQIQRMAVYQRALLQNEVAPAAIRAICLNHQRAQTLHIAQAELFAMTHPSANDTPFAPPGAA